MPALVTPFVRNGRIDLDAHRHNAETMLGRGIAGLLLGGTNGEGHYLEPGEREQLIATARETVPRAFLLAGIAAQSLRMALAQAAEAAAGGADAVLALPPTEVVRNRHHLVEQFYLDLAEASDLPVFLYSHPKVTLYEIPTETIVAVAQHPNVVGMKDSGGHPVRASAVMNATPDGFILYAGASAALALSVAAGAHGAITASTNHLPELVTEVVGRARRSPRTAATPQRSLTTAATAIEAFGIPGTKAAARLAGLKPGLARRPLLPLKRSQQRAVERAWLAAVADRTPA